MPKRSNPYSEDYSPQIKVHVGEKQFRNNGRKLQEVYEKTLDLLYQGAKRSCACSESSIPELSDCLQKKEKLKQLSIDRNGFLEVSENIVSRARPCPRCACGGRGADHRCAYCETPLCPSCSHLCCTCHLVYCRTCVVYGSEGAEVCVSCS